MIRGPIQVSQSREIHHEYPGPGDPDFSVSSWGRPKLIPSQEIRLQVQLDLRYHREEDAILIQDLLAALRAIQEKTNP